MKTTMKLFTIISLLFIVGSSYGQYTRSITDIEVSDKLMGTFKLAQISTEQHWLLIIINKNLNISQQLLEQLKDKRINLDKTVILITNNKTKKHAFKKYQQELAVAAWVELEDSEILNQLNIAATPIILGMQTDQVKWKLSGLPSKSEFNNTILQINNWTNK